MLPSLARTALTLQLFHSARRVTRATSARHYAAMAEPDPTPEQVVAQLKQVQSEVEALRVKHNLTKLVVLFTMLINTLALKLMRSVIYLATSSRCVQDQVSAAN